MTPAQHATAAAAEIGNSNSAGNIPATCVQHARIAVVHAVLSTKAGTGSNYAAAETLLATAATETWSPYQLDQALTHAHLAEPLP